MTIVIVTPPPLKPSEPGVSAGAAATVLRRLGVPAESLDASIGWHRFALEPTRLEGNLEQARRAGWSRGDLLAARQSCSAFSGRSAPLRRAATYRDRQVYTSAIRQLEHALRLAAAPFPELRLGLAMVSPSSGDGRLESSRVLETLARQPGPFDQYFLEELLPELRRRSPQALGLSLSFQQQAPAAFRLAQLLEERWPELPRLLGGPLVSSWRAAGLELSTPPFHRFHRLCPGDDQDMATLALELGAMASATAPESGPLAVDLDEAPWEDYLTPSPVIPAALGRGCSWRRCTFCPEQLHPVHLPCPPDQLEGWLHQVAARFPGGAMLHLTDAALPPRHLARIAEVIRRDRLPLRWHGFARIEPALADPDFARALVEGGGAMLQLGVESGSPRMLALMRKSWSDPALAEAVLQALAEAGLRSHLYLLFGLPGETDEDRELTLALVERQAGGIHAINPALLNLPIRSPMHRDPERFGITELRPFHESTDLSLSVDFRCGASHPRLEARRWLEHRFFKSAAVRAIAGRLRTPFKANHLCFLE